MRLSREGIRQGEFAQKGYILPQFDIEKMRRVTAAAPVWAHLGAGNILRAFPAVLCQRLLESGAMDTGMCVVECYDEQIIEKAFAPYDNLAVAVSLRRDGRMDKRVVASVAQALGYSAGPERVRQIFTAPSLQMVSMTITEKGYAVADASGQPLPFCRGDFTSMDAPASIIGKLVKLLYARYQAGALPIALVSLDNCSHNGSILRESVERIARAWLANGLVKPGFMDYLFDPARVSFPWSMIDKITPRPAPEIIGALERDGLEDIGLSITEKNSYVSAMVNAEECEYLAIEDHFPNGRPPLEKVGVIFGDRQTIDKIEKMKVCTCLNPLHTCLAIFGCLLGYGRICEEMDDAALLALVKRVGYDEGLRVAVDPGVMSARKFIDEVVNLRLPNPFVPDTPQRIACDTSKKLPVRFGETLKAYLSRGQRDLSFLTGMALVFAGYARYLTGIGDGFTPFERSSDPNLEALSACVAGFEPGRPFDAGKLRGLFSNADLFGVDLYSVNLGKKAESLFTEMNEGPGAIHATIARHVNP